MKRASVREVQHDLKRVLGWVARGEEVLVHRRTKVVARLVPPAPDAPSSPDFVARARKVWGDRPRGTPLSKVVSDARGDR
jgi:antitoxin (DNA-binding transcriptional repressor) of toxin-antitoxin stability system